MTFDYQDLVSWNRSEKGWYGKTNLHDAKRIIVGVVENHIDNVYRSKGPEPFVFYPTTKSTNVLMLVKADKADLPEVKQYLEKTW